MAQATYSIQRVGLTDPGNAVGLYVGLDGSGGNIETNTLYYTDPTGAVVGATQEYNGTASYSYSADWVYNGSSTIQVGLNAANGSQYVKPAAAGAVAGDVNTSMYSAGFGGTRLYNNGYVGGVSARYDSSNNAEGPDAWLFNGATTSKIPLPTFASGGSNTTFGANLAYSYVNANSDTIQSMGGGSNIVLPGGNGTAVGVALEYYNSGTVGAPVWTVVGNGFSDYDAWYYNGSGTIQIGLISGNNVNSAGTTGVSNTSSQKFAFDRASQPIEISTSGVVFGFSKYYGGSATLTASNGQDLWIYDPNNATGSGANGTMLVAPPTAITGNSYTGGNSTLATPAYSNNSGQFAAAFQMFANTDTARATALAQDAFIGNYNGTSVTWTQVGLTSSVNPVYTFYTGIGSTSVVQAGFGGSNIGLSGSSFGGPQMPASPPLNAAGQAVGYSKRTAANASTGGVSLGQDAWVYYPPTAVPTGAVAGTTQIGLTGGVYSTNLGNGGVTQFSAPSGLSTKGAVAGTSQRYLNSTSTTSAGQDAWYYDPAHGITTTVQVGLTGGAYSTTPIGPGNNYSSSTITALNNTGMVGGTTYRNATSANSRGNGVDAWVFSAATGKTYSVDPYTPTFATGSGDFTISTITSISDSGVVYGYDFFNYASSFYPSSVAANLTQAFEWYLGYDTGDGLYDTPTFTYLSNVVNLSGSFNQLDVVGNASGFVDSTSLPASGNLAGLGGLSTDDSSSYVPFVLSPSTVPEPASICLVGLGGFALLARRRQKA